MINFNEPFYTGNELKYIQKMMATGNLQGSCDSHGITDILKEAFACQKVYLVHSCTAALEIAALSLDIKDGDEVIMPSYTYVSTANAFALRGAKIIFVDVDEKNMNINLEAVEKAITCKTKAIVPVHYAGVSCDMDKLILLAKKHNISIVEDAAQAIFSKYKDKYLGTIGHLGCISLHETKNITAGGEGGILLVNDEKLIKKIDMLVEKGTNRSKFLKGNVDKYTWQSLGSSYLMNQLNVGFFMAQYQYAQKITSFRLDIFKTYKEALYGLVEDKKIEILEVKSYNKSNGHIFYIKCKDSVERRALITYLKTKAVDTRSHYEPLHNSLAGNKYGEFSGSDLVTSRDSKRLLRLPLHMSLTKEDVLKVLDHIKEFYQNK